jgi:transcriptional regulator of heat shock response
MYKYISFGRSCDIRATIDTFIGKQETNFFDWLRVDLKTVIEILQMKDLEKELLNKPNLRVDKELYAYDKMYAITFENLNTKKICCLSHDDIHSKEYTEQELDGQLNEFIEKYKRRHVRMIDLIKKCEKPIVFIHRVSNSTNFNEDEDVNKLLHVLLNINPNAKFCFVLLVDEEKDYIQIKQKNYLKINYNKLKNEGWKIEWRSQFIKWQEVLKIIQQYAF